MYVCMCVCVYVCVYACVRAPAGVRCNCSIRMQGQRGYLNALRVNVDKYLLVGVASSKSSFGVGGPADKRWRRLRRFL